MAQLAIAGAGALLGGALGSAVGYASLGASIGWALGGLAGNMLFGPKPPSIEGPRLGDLSVQTSTYGAAIPIVYGTVRLAGNIIWAKPIREQVNRRRVRAGKGGRRRQTVTEYEYFGSWASAFCEGPIDQVLRIWFDAHLVYDVTGSSEVVSIPGLRFRIYQGTESQLPDPLIEQNVGSNNAVPFRGLCYIVFEDVPLARVGNRIPSVSVELTVQSTRSYVYEIVGPRIPDVLSNTNLTNVGGVCQDIERNIQYYVYGSSTQDIGLVERVDWITLTRTSYALQSPGGTFKPNCVATLDGLMAGRLNWGAPRTTRIACWDADTGTLRGTFGTETFHNSLDSDANLGVSANNNYFSSMIVRVFGADGPEYFYVLAVQYTNLWISKLPSGPYVVGSSVSSQYQFNPIVPTGFYYQAAVCQGAERPGSSVFYHFFTYNEINGPWYLHVYEIAPNAMGGTTFATGIKVRRYSYTSTQLGFASNNHFVADKRILGAIRDRLDDSVIVMLQSFDQDNTCWAKLREDGSVAWTYSFGNNIFEANYHSINATSFTELKDARQLLIIRQMPAPGFTGRVFDVDSQQFVATGTVNIVPGQSQHAINPVPTFIPELRAYTFRGSNHFARYRFPFFTGQGTTLSAIVSDLCARAGLQSSDIDVSQLTDSVRGFIVSRRGPVRSSIEPLAAAYAFDAVERGTQIVFRKRSGATVATIPYSDIVRRGDDAIFEELRAQDADLPRSITVRHIDKDRNYDIGAQTWARPLSPEQVISSITETTFDLPIVLTPNEAKGIAQRLVISSWRERVRYRFTLPHRYLRLEPTDPIIVTRPDNTQQRCRILSTQFGQDWAIEIEAVEETDATFSPLPSDGGQGNQTQTIPFLAPPEPLAPELPLLAPGDDTSGQGLRFYFTASSLLNRTYLGSEAYLQSGSTFSFLDSLPDAASWGIVTTALDAPRSYWTWDRENELVVLVQQGISNFTSETELNVLNGANRCAVFDAIGRVEIIHFAQVTQLSSTTIRLSVLLRGRLGTEDAGPFDAGARIVLLDDSIRSAIGASSSLNTVRILRFTSNGVPQNGSEARYTVRGRAEQPWAPVHIRGTRNNANDVTITWVRRTRFNGELVDFTGTVPLNEDTEAYDVEIRNPADTTTVRSFLNLSSPTVTYTAAQQTTDGLTPGDPVRVRVWQRSALVGRGRMGSAIV